MLKDLFETMDEKLYSLVTKIAPAYNNYIGNGKLRLGRRSTQPVTGLTGYKLMYMMMTSDNKIKFKSPTHENHNLYPAQARAACKLGDHDRTRVAVSNCSCGWYSFNTLDPAFSYDHRATYVVETAISGSFVEYELGYRSEYQRVKSVIAKDCHRHQNPAVAFLPFSERYQSEAYIKAACEKCLEEYGYKVALSAEEVSNMIDLGEGNTTKPKVVSCYSGRDFLSAEEIKERRNRFLSRTKQIMRSILLKLEHLGKGDPVIPGVLLGGATFTVIVTGASIISTFAQQAIR